MPDELLAGEDPAEAFRDGELLSEMRRAVAERVLNAEMDMHLSRELELASGNHRNGHNRKRVATGSGSMDLAVPRDRLGLFEPELVEKYVRRLPGFDDKVILMYARHEDAGGRGARGGDLRAIGVAGVSLEGNGRGQRGSAGLSVEALGASVHDRLLRRGPGEDPRRLVLRTRGWFATRRCIWRSAWGARRCSACGWSARRVRSSGCR